YRGALAQLRPCWGSTGCYCPVFAGTSFDLRRYGILGGVLPCGALAPLPGIDRLVAMTTAKISSEPSESAKPAPPGSLPPPGKTRINKAVFYGSALLVLAIALWAIIDRDSANLAISAAVTWIGRNFGWYYTLVVVAVLVFVIGVAISKVGKTRLGPDHSRPSFNIFTWAAMLFAAGIGIDLMFFSVAEPVTQYLAPPAMEGSTVEAARQALVWTLFHYGLLGWGLYALVGL